MSRYGKLRGVGNVQSTIGRCALTRKERTKANGCISAGVGNGPQEHALYFALAVNTSHYQTKVW